MKTLLESYSKSKINLKFEDRNCLHLLLSIFDNSAKKKEFKNVADCIKLLLLAGCDPNMPDADSRTPFFMLLKLKTRIDANLHDELINFFLKNAKIDVYTYRSDEMFQMLKIQGIPIPEKIELVVNFEFMQNLLDCGDDIEFIESFQEFKEHCEMLKSSETEANGKATRDTKDLVKSKNDSDNLSENFVENCAVFLVEAVKNGMTSVVEYLLNEEHVDVNRYPKFEMPAAFIACSRGNYEILDVFLNHTDVDGAYDLSVTHKRESFEKGKTNEKNLLHEVCSHFGFASDLESNQNYQKCFDLLMSCSEIEVNQQDELGLTPLYYAIRYKNDEATKALLRKCYVGQRNIFNKAQIYHIGKEVFQEFLDECITMRVDEPTGDQKITIDFNFLVAPKQESQEFFEEIAPLEEIANNKELRELILHPVLSTFLYLKWIKLSILFYTNLLFFFFFMGSFTTYIVLYKSDTFFVLSMASLTLMMMKEFVQCYLSYKNYFKTSMNWFELILTVLIFIVLVDTQYKSFHDNLAELIGPKTIKIIRGVTILCATYEFLILFGDLPNFSISTHMIILRRVFITFLKSIGLYSILLIGFAFCFYTLFGDDADDLIKSESNGTKSKEDDEENFHNFKKPGFAIIKTIVMFSGELEASSLNLGNNDAFYSIIFIMFVFLISIVLLNLINGLSVSDVFQIKAEGHLVDLCQKIHVLNKYERIIMSRKSSFRCLKSIISIFPKFIKLGKIDIDHNSKVKLGSRTNEPKESILECFYNKLLKSFINFDSLLKYLNKSDAIKNQKPHSEGFSVRIDNKIMRKIKTVLEERGQKGNKIEHEDRIAGIESKLKVLDTVDEKLEYIMNVLKERF